MKWWALSATLLLARGAGAQEQVGDPAGLRVDPRASLPRGTPEGRQQHVLDVQSTATSWETSVRLPLFDPADGVLRSVFITLSTELTGEASVESLDLEPTQVDLHFSAIVRLMKPRGDVLIELRPRQNFVDQLQAFDGAVDFGGASGVCHFDLEIHDSATPVEAQVTDLAFFTGRRDGAGSIDMLIAAEGTSSADGPGNMTTQFLQAASVHATVTYVFEPDCNGNGVPDVDDIADAASHDTNLNAVPDECEAVAAFCFGDGPENGGAECPCGNSTTGNTAGCLNSMGRGGLLEGTGTARVGADTFRLVASQMPANTASMWMQSKDTSQPGTGVPFAAGLLCLADGMTRMGVLEVPADGGPAVYPRNGELSLSEKFGIQVGEKRVFQVWYRDTAGPCGVNPNTTNGVVVVWR